MMTFSKVTLCIRPIWQIRLQNMVMVMSYFIKQSVLNVFSNGVLLDDQKPMLTQYAAYEFVAVIPCLICCSCESNSKS